jgi:hypothetical protein
VERIIRDPKRKLGWSDRLFGTMRMALEAGITPRTMALGAAATLAYAMSIEGAKGAPRDFLLALWGADASGPQRDECLALVETAAAELRLPYSIPSRISGG